MNKKIIFLGGILMMLLFPCIYAATGSNRISIDNDRQQLIAPEGESYQWYLNGELLEDRTQQIQVKESGTYRVEITNVHGENTSQTIRIAVKADGIREIIIIGDSTVQTYPESDYPLTGWGQVLSLFFDDSKVKVTNKAIGGRSSRSFWEEGRWDEVLTMLDTNDYVFIQFGHNDRDWTKPERYTDTAAYKDYLRIYVNESREKGAIPVLVSPMIMNAWNGTTLRNVFTEGENDYRGAMLEVAEELDVLFVDLNMKSWELINQLGSVYAARFLYMGLEPGEYPNYPDGSSDVGTHFQEMGALTMAGLILEGINELEEDTTITYLIDAQTPMASVNTAFNMEAEGYLTVPGMFPVGAHITLKTRMYSVNTFDHWEDTLGINVSNDNLFMFTLNDTSCYYVACVTDCNDEVGGDAIMDPCQLCAGGSTGYPACEVVFESEDACVYSGYPMISTVGGLRRIVVNTNTEDYSPYVGYSVEAYESGTYDFLFICLSKTEGEQLSVQVNDVEQVSGLDLEQDDVWNEVRFQLELEEGINTIVVQSSAPEGDIQFDLLAAYSTALTTGDCSILTTGNMKIPGVIVFPNPFSESMSLQVEGPFEYRVYSVTGLLLEAGSARDRCTIGSDLQPGMYLLHILDNEGIRSQRIRKN